MKKLDLRKLRTDAELSQAGIAAQLGVDHSTWFRAEKYNEVGTKLAAALSREFGIPMETWFPEATKR